MIRNDEVFKIGFISKNRGLRGEVELSFTDDCFDRGTCRRRGSRDLTLNC